MVTDSGSSKNRGETVIVADDDASIRTVLTRALEGQGYKVRTANSVASLLALVDIAPADLIITDVYMPEASVLDVLPHIKSAQPNVPLIVMSAHSTLRMAIDATAHGAYEYLAKPFDLDEMLAVVERALKIREAKPAEARAGFTPDADEFPLIGRSPPMQEVYRVLARLMPTDLTVLVSGESGTGKELIARALHQFGRRKAGHFSAVNMAAIPKDLIEAELFGHEKGAFTGATERGVGRFEQAHGGTLFLDEIGDMPLEAQTRLLRVLQEGEITRVGGRNAIKTDVRIVAATHRDLRRLIARGGFREDLYYRLNVVPLQLPPLRERRDDIPDLVQHFLVEASKDGLAVKTFDAGAMAALKEDEWRGNVRELENLVRRVAALYSEDIIPASVVDHELKRSATAGMADTEATAGPSQETLSEAVERHLKIFFDRHEDDLPASGLYDRILHEVERPLIELSLRATHGNQIKAADLLGINRNTLRKKIKELGIEVIKGTK